MHALTCWLGRDEDDANGQQHEKHDVTYSICTHTCTHARICARANTHAHTHACTHAPVRTMACALSNSSVCACTSTCPLLVYTHACTCLPKHARVRACRERERERETHTTCNQQRMRVLLTTVNMQHSSVRTITRYRSKKEAICKKFLGCV